MFYLKQRVSYYYVLESSYVAYHRRIQDFRLGGALNLDGRSLRAPHLGVGGRDGLGDLDINIVGVLF